MTKSLRFALLSFVIAGFTTGIVAAQKKSEGSMQCRESRENDRLSSHCEIKEQTLPAGGAITVDGKTNGGISIKGWERNEILVRAKIETRAPTQAEADQLGQQVRIETGALNIRAEGPAPRRLHAGAGGPRIDPGRRRCRDRPRRDDAGVGIGLTVKNSAGIVSKRLRRIALRGGHR